MKLKKLHLSLFALGTCFASTAQTSLEQIVINIDENIKTNTTIGRVSFLDGVSDKSVRIEVGTTELRNWVTNGEAFESISFSSSFSEAVLNSSSPSSGPIVFGQIQSDSDYEVEYEVNTYSYSGLENKNHKQLLMRHRLNNVSALGFDAILESQLDKKGTSVIQNFTSTGEGETLGWVAFSEPVSAIWQDKPIQVSSTGSVVTNNISYSHFW